MAKSNNISSELTELKEIKEAGKADSDIKVEFSDIRYEGEMPTLVKYSIINGERSLNVEIGVMGKETSVNRWSTKTKSDDSEYELEIPD